MSERPLLLTVWVVHRTPLEDARRADRNAALLRSLVSTHTILGVRGVAFQSLLDPLEPFREAADCCNRGAWSVLVGEEGSRDTILSSPILLRDSPERLGDLFDGMEIDEDPDAADLNAGGGGETRRGRAGCSSPRPAPEPARNHPSLTTEFVIG